MLTFTCMRSLVVSFTAIYIVLLLCLSVLVISCEKSSEYESSDESAALVLDAASEITDCSAVISGMVHLSSIFHDSAEYGFQYSESKNFRKDVVSVNVIGSDHENRFRIKISSLIPRTTYYYRSYIKFDNSVVYGPTQTFKTDSELSPTVPDGYENLSKSYGANCYIVSQAGSYCFPSVRGNSSNSSTEWLVKTTSVKVLWETFGTDEIPLEGDLVKSVFYEDGYIGFQTADNFKEGNAVIAALNAKDEILWSWHIWFTDLPQEQVYFNNAGIMMDRNLGATSTTPGDVRTQGLLYQWGRKDPFLNSMIINPGDLDTVPLAESTIAWPDAYLSPVTIEFAVANPTTLIYPSYGNWLSTEDNDDLWSSQKTKYDPCPEGWRIPDGGPSGVWGRALGVSQYFTDETLFDQERKGIECSGKLGNCSSIWYPAAGFREMGRVTSNGFSGCYWSVSTSGNLSLEFVFNYLSPNIYIAFDSPRLKCGSVRCLKE